MPRFKNTAQSCCEKRKPKSSVTQKCVLLIAPSPGCSSLTVQDDVWSEFDTRRLFSYSSAEVGKASPYSGLQLNLILAYAHAQDDFVAAQHIV